MLRSDLTSALSASLGGTAENAIDLALEQTVIFAHGDFIQAYAPALMERELEPWITSAVSQSRQQEMPLEDASLSNILKTDDDYDALSDEQRRAALGAITIERLSYKKLR